MKSAGMKKFLLVRQAHHGLVLVALVGSSVMLTVIQSPFNVSALAWVSLVPFIWACRPKVKIKPLLITAYIISLCYWLGNLYWIYPVTPTGWVAFCMYTALLWPMLVVCLRYCREKKIPLVLAVPVLIVGAERLQGLFLGGFFWRFLAHSQYTNITLIQIADIFGAAGVSFLVAMVNAMAAELIIAAEEKKIFKIGIFLKVGLVCGLMAATIFYGRHRIAESEKYIEAGPMVASVQTNVPQSVKKSHMASEEILDELLQNSNASAKAGAELVVWPETMVQAMLDPKILAFLPPSESDRLFDEILRAHSRNTAYVLAGAYGGTVGTNDDGTVYLAKRYNSAFLYRPDGTQAKEQYSKIHLVAFGEYIPFKASLPLIFKLMMKFTPYDYDYTLDAGSEYTVFEMAGKEGQVYRFSAMICYEDAVPAIARRLAINKKGEKNIDWLVNISNDGWFVRFKDGFDKLTAGGKTYPSTELSQHAAVCVFRAVENRLAVVRSVNTGISCFIDTLGQIRNGYVAGSLPHRAMARTGMSGWLVDRVLIDKRTTFFSRHGQWLDFCCAVCFVCLMIMPGLGRFLLRKGPKNNRKAER
ncbi:MAG: apolipoprotein N-acyltransferase [Phycisphaerae bacterium]|nr:apolipoprotein N-acyltransferase [Phycisphaerae bacterium]